MKRHTADLPPVELPLEWDDLPDVASANEAAGNAAWRGARDPLAFFERIITMSSNPEDLVVVPFCDSGTAVLAADLLGRRWLGIAESQIGMDHCLTRVTKADQPTAPVVTVIDECGLKPMPIYDIATERALLSIAEISTLAARTAQIERLGWSSILEASVAQALWRRGVAVVPMFRVPGSRHVVGLFLPSPPRGAIELIVTRGRRESKINAISSDAEKTRATFGETVRVYAVIFQPRLRQEHERQLTASGVHVLYGDDSDLDTVAREIATDFLAHRPAGTPASGNIDSESVLVPQDDDFSPALTTLAITYERLFGGTDLRVFRHELDILRAEIAHQHFTAAALRVGRSLEYIIASACRSWQIPIREPVLAALKRLEDRFQDLRTALSDYATIEEDNHKLEQARRAVKARADDVNKCVSDIIFDIAASASKTLDGSGAPINTRAMLADIKKRHGRLPEVRTNIDALLKGDRSPIAILLEKRNDAAHASLDGESREVTETALRSMVDLLNEILLRLSNCGVAILTAADAS